MSAPGRHPSPSPPKVYENKPGWVRRPAPAVPAGGPAGVPALRDGAAAQRHDVVQAPAGAGGADGPGGPAAPDPDLPFRPGDVAGGRTPAWVVRRCGNKQVFCLCFLFYLEKFSFFPEDFCVFFVGGFLCDIFLTSVGNRSSHQKSGPRPRGCSNQPAAFFHPGRFFSGPPLLTSSFPLAAQRAAGR